MLSFFKGIFSSPVSDPTLQILETSSALPIHVFKWNHQLVRDLEKTIDRSDGDETSEGYFGNSRPDFLIAMSSLMFVNAEMAIALWFDDPSLCDRSMKTIEKTLIAIEKVARTYGSEKEGNPVSLKMLEYWSQTRDKCCGHDVCKTMQKVVSDQQALSATMSELGLKNKTPLSANEAFLDRFSTAVYTNTSSLQSDWEALLQKKVPLLCLIQESGTTLQELLYHYGLNVGISQVFGLRPSWYRSSVPYGSFESFQSKG